MQLSEDLVSALKSGNVIPFVGAGVSMNVLLSRSQKPLFPSWKGLLFDAVEYLRKQNKVHQANAVEGMLNFDQVDYLTVAEHCREHLKNAWYPFLQRKLDPSRDLIDEASLVVPKLVWAINPKVVLTTNYDRTLMWACPKAYDVWELDIEAPPELASLIQSEFEHPIIWHLHGHIRNKSNLVITSSDYQRMYPSSDSDISLYPAAMQALQNLLVTKSFLFIGASMNDPYITKQINNIYTRFKTGGRPHFILVSNKEKELFLTKRLPLEPIYYEDHGKPLINLLEKMADLVSPRNNKKDGVVLTSNHGQADILNNPVEKYLNYIETSGRFSTFTARDYRRKITTIESHLNKPITSATESDLSNWWENENKKGNSKNTIQNKHNLLRGFFKYCRQHGLVSHDPTRIFPETERPEETYDYCSDAVVDKIRKGLRKETSLDIRANLIFSMALEIGLQPTEMRSLTMDDLNLNRKELNLARVRVPRVLSIPDSLLGLIKEWIAVRPAGDGPLLCSISQPISVISDCTIRSDVKRVASNAGIDSKYISPQKLRNTCIFRALEKGISLTDIQSLAGHVTLSTTTKFFQRYQSERLRKML